MELVQTVLDPEFEYEVSVGGQIYKAGANKVRALEEGKIVGNLFLDKVYYKTKNVHLGGYISFGPGTIQIHGSETTKETVMKTKKDLRIKRVTLADIAWAEDHENSFGNFKRDLILRLMSRGLALPDNEDVFTFFGKAHRKYQAFLENL